jgi:biopolymer transport protein ExbD
MESEALIFKARRRGIGLTALIDVVFILLMFFMLTSSFTRWKAVDFHSPVVSEATQSEVPVFAILHSDGALSVRKPHFSIAHYQDLTAANFVHFSAASATVLIAHPDATVQHVVGALESLKNIGVGSVTLGAVLPADAKI